MRGWEHGAGESPFLGQAGGGCGAGGAFLAGRAAGTNVFPTWPRIPGSARSHGQDTPAATPAPAASFPQRGERGRECGGGCGTGFFWGAVGACALASQGPAPRASCAPWETTEQGSFSENKSRVGRWNWGRKEARTAMDPWPRPCFSGPHSSAPALCKAEGAVWLEGAAARLAAGRPQFRQPQIRRHLPPPLLPDPWALVGVGDYLRLWGIRWGTGAGVPGRGHTQSLIPWGGGQP